MAALSLAAMAQHEEDTENAAMQNSSRFSLASITMKKIQKTV